MIPVDDLWFLRTRDPITGERQWSQRHGRGKRWRVGWVHPDTGQTRTGLFTRRAEADRHDANMHVDISRGQYVDPREGKLTVAAYAEQWRKTLLHRGSTAERVERVIRRHIVPVRRARHPPRAVPGPRPGHRGRDRPTHPDRPACRAGVHARRRPGWGTPRRRSRSTPTSGTGRTPSTRPGRWWTPRSVVPALYPRG